MGIVGIDMVHSTPNYVSSTADPNGLGTQDNYVYTIDLSTATDYTLTGGFWGGPGRQDDDFTHTYSAPAGTFTIHPSQGEFSYTLTQADALLHSLTQVIFTVTGTSYPDGPSDPFPPVVDTDTITFNITPCFAAGTLIATLGAQQLVENIGIGDPVLAADGRAVLVKWIGRTAIHPIFNPADRLEPVSIRKGAFGPNVPHTDLIVTADHGMVIDGILINAGALINGNTINWYPWKAIGQSLSYYHIETEHHDIILANSAPAETFVDYVGRQAFDNYQEYLDLYGAERIIPEMDRPRISSQRLVPDAIKARLGIVDEVIDFDIPLSG